MKLSALIMLMLSVNSAYAQLGPQTKSIIVNYSAPDRIKTSVFAYRACEEVGISGAKFKDILHRKLVLNRIKPEESAISKINQDELFIESIIYCIIDEYRITANVHLELRIKVGADFTDSIGLGYGRTSTMYGPRTGNLNYFYDGYEKKAEEIVADFIGAHLEADDIRDAMPSNQRSVRKY